MVITLHFHMVFMKFSEITNNKQIFRQYNIFYIYKYLFFQFAFWSLQSLPKKSIKLVCCSWPCFSAFLCTHYRLLQCFSTYLINWKKSEFYGPYFQTVIFCDYELGQLKLLTNTYKQSQSTYSLSLFEHMEIRYSQNPVYWIRLRTTTSGTGHLATKYSNNIWQVLSWISKK